MWTCVSRASRGPVWPPLRGLTRLSKLYLNGCPLTDAGLAPLADCRSLETLSLIDTDITDADTRPSPASRPPAQLDLTRVAPSPTRASRSFTAALPNTHIIR